MLPILELLLLLSPQDPEVLSQTQRELPRLGTAVHETRVFDRETGRIGRRAVDGSGRPVDADALRAEDLRRRDAENGKLHPGLVEKLADGEAHQLAFWLAEPVTLPDLREVIDAARRAGLHPEDARREALAVARAIVQPGNATFAAAAAAAGCEVLLVDDITPVVIARGRAAQARALAARPEVDLVYWASPAWYAEEVDGEPVPPARRAPPSHWASKTARTDIVHARGITGGSVKVMVNDVGPVNANNPFLPPLVSGNSGSSSHATAVAGIIASTHVPETGAAPGLTQLFSYGGSGDVNAPMAWAWAMTQGVSFGNCSWWNGQKGQIRFLDRYFDYIIRQFAVMMFKSTGNQGNGDGKVTTPGCGYNMTNSGNVQDQNNHDWNDDTMTGSSSWVNPIEGHDKPEVSACGTTITTTTTSSPWIGSAGTGTSYASPVTCGTAALLADTVPALQAQPEVVRALLMAGAFHNVEGSPRLSDRDGVGHIDAAASQSAAARGQFHSATLLPGSFVNGNYDVQVQLVANDETRICGVWFSRADSSYSTDVLDMDLDLVVRLGNTVIAASASQDNAFEIVQFVPPVSGTYTLRFQRQRFDGASEPFAVAWVDRRNAATNEVVVTGNLTPGGTAMFEFVDTYHPGAQYLAALSMIGPPATMPVGPLKVVEIGLDPIVQASVSVPGFGGVLGGNGRANASLVLPNLPWLSGVSMHAAMVSIDFGLPELVEETSPTTTFTIQ